MKIKAFVPTSDWYFVSDTQPHPRRLVGFAIIDRGDDSDAIIGMIPVTNGGGAVDETFCALAPVPPETGTYRHCSVFTN